MNVPDYLVCFCTKIYLSELGIYWDCWNPKLFPHWNEKLQQIKSFSPNKSWYAVRDVHASSTRWSHLTKNSSLLPMLADNQHKATGRRWGCTAERSSIRITVDHLTVVVHITDWTSIYLRSAAGWWNMEKLVFLFCDLHLSPLSLLFLSPIRWVYV